MPPTKNALEGNKQDRDYSTMNPAFVELCTILLGVEGIQNDQHVGGYLCQHAIPYATYAGDFLIFGVNETFAGGKKYKAFPNMPALEEHLQSQGLHEILEGQEGVEVPHKFIWVGGEGINLIFVSEGIAKNYLSDRVCQTLLRAISLLEDLSND